MAMSDQTLVQLAHDGLGASESVLVVDEDDFQWLRLQDRLALISRMNDFQK